MSALTLILILFVEIGLQSGFLLLLPAVLSTPTFGTLTYEYSTALDSADGAADAVGRQHWPD